MQTKKTKKRKGANSNRKKGVAEMENRFRFTQDMRFIVVRNKRNPWLDEIYETPPDQADLPVFN